MRDGGPTRSPFGDLMRGIGADLADAAAKRRTSASDPRRNWRRLLKGVTPAADESLRGLVVRACHANDLPNSWGLLQHLGQTHRNRILLSADANVDPAELAYAIKVEEEEVLSWRYPLLNASKASFFGLAIDTRRIENRVRRISPTALQSERHHRATWELRDVPFCLDHWDMLQDRCWCEKDGVVQGWTRTGSAVHECDRCGDPLHWLDPVPVPSDMRSALSVLIPIVHPVASLRDDFAAFLPEDLRKADRGTLFRTIIRLGNMLAPQAAKASAEAPRERLAGLHAACLRLASWPWGLDDVEWPGGTPAPAVASVRAAWAQLRPLPSEPAVGFPPAPFTAGRDVERGPRLASARPSANGMSRTVGIRRATEIAKLSADMLLLAWEHGLVTRHHRAHGSRMLPAFDPAELEAFAAQWQKRVPPDKLAHMLSISLHGVEQLTALGVIAADGPSLPGTGPHFRRQDVDAFLDELLGGAVPSVERAVPLREMMLRIGGRPKPWGQVLDQLRRGAIPFALGSGTRLTERIQISLATAPLIAELRFDRTDHPTFEFSPQLVQGDALELLNVSEGHVRVLAGLESTGTNPKLYSVAAVEARAALYVTSPEIAAVAGLPLAKALKWASAKEPASQPGLWPRSLLANLLASVVPSVFD